MTSIAAAILIGMTQGPREGEGGLGSIPCDDVILPTGVCQPKPGKKCYDGYDEFFTDGTPTAILASYHATTPRCDDAPDDCLASVGVYTFSLDCEQE
jgi:hypothetical protein